MNDPLGFSLDDYGDDVHDEDIVYEPLDDVAWVDEEDVDAIEVTADEVVAPVEAATLAPADPEVLEVPAPASDETTTEEDAPRVDAPSSEPLLAPAPTGAPCLYRVVIPLADDLREAIAGVRGDHALEGSAPAALELIAPFRAEDPDALAEILRAWAVERLPLDMTLNDVSAEIIGARRYVAGWALAPAGRIAAAQQALVRALGSMVEPCDDAPDAFEPRVVVADRVPPPVFPHLIADMQRAFEPQNWSIDGIVLEESISGGRAPRWTPRLTLP